MYITVCKIITYKHRLFLYRFVSYKLIKLQHQTNFTKQNRHCLASTLCFCRPASFHLR